MARERVCKNALYAYKKVHIEKIGYPLISVFSFLHGDNLKLVSADYE